jgi:hypothetical protein
MAKINNGSLVLDPNDKIKYLDSVGNEHTIFWDELLSRFLLNGNVEAEHYIGATHSTIHDRDPLPTDNTFLVPTIWVNEVTKIPFILIYNSINTIPCSNDNVSTWIQIGGGTTQSNYITIRNEGVDVSTNASVINFVGATVEAAIQTDGSIDVYIPPVIDNYVSHWNSNDGTSPNIVPDTTTTQRLVSDPTIL